MQIAFRRAEFFKTKFTMFGISFVRKILKIIYKNQYGVCQIFFLTVPAPVTL